MQNEVKCMRLEIFLRTNKVLLFYKQYPDLQKDIQQQMFQQINYLAII